MATSQHHYKVFTHLWQPSGLQEVRLIVLSKTEMTPDEIKAVIDRSGRAIAGQAWIEEVPAGSYPEPAAFETPEDYLLIGVLADDTPGTMPDRPTDRDPTADYPFARRA